MTRGAVVRLVSVTLAAAVLAAVLVSVMASARAQPRTSGSKCTCTPEGLANNPHSNVYNCVCDGFQCVVVVSGGTTSIPTFSNSIACNTAGR
jgi:hypothetical protein